MTFMNTMLPINKNCLIEILMKLKQFLALTCWVCENARSHDDCLRRGRSRQCQLNQVRESSGFNFYYQRLCCVGYISKRDYIPLIMNFCSLNFKNGFKSFYCYSKNSKMLLQMKQSISARPHVQWLCAVGTRIFRGLHSLTL